MLHNVAKLSIICGDKLQRGDNVTKRAKMLHNGAKKFDWAVNMSISELQIRKRYIHRNRKIYTSNSFTLSILYEQQQHSFKLNKCKEVFKRVGPIMKENN